MMSSKPTLCVVVVIWILLLGAPKIHGDGNPANELVALVNGKRAGSKLPSLRNSAGLGCMALQYISECMAMTAAAAACSSSDNTVACQPPEAHITEVYAANCGVELPTVDIISGRLVGCCNHRDDVMASANGNNGTQSQIMLGKEHSQVGAALDRRGRDGPFFWCLLFSSGSANSTFLLDNGGKGIHQTHGCFSAPDTTTTCNAAAPGAGAVAALLLLLILFHSHFLVLS